MSSSTFFIMGFVGIVSFLFMFWLLKKMIPERKLDRVSRGKLIFLIIAVPVLSAPLLIFGFYSYWLPFKSFLQ